MNHSKTHGQSPHRFAGMNWIRFGAAGFLAAAALALIPPAGVAAQDVGGPKITGPADVDAFVLKAMRDFQIPGAVIVVVRDGKPLVLKGYGVRDRATGAPVDADTLFQLASVSKSFAAAAFAAQASRGTADWEKPVRQVLPDFQMMEPCATKLATPKDMLVHRSGLPRFEGDLLERLGFDRAQIFARVRYIKPSYSFRDHPEYNNIGFFIAGEVTAKLAGKRWEEAVEKLVLKPAGMKRTGLAKPLMNGDANAAKPYVISGGKVKQVAPNRQDQLAAAGGLASTGRDMAAFANLLLAGGKPVIDEENLDIMFEPVISEKPGFTELPPISEESGFAYSPGWGVYYYGNTKIIEKGGALDGYRSLITLIPEKKLGVITLCNMGLTGFPEAIRAEVIAREFGGPGKKWQTEILAATQKIAKMFVTPTPPDDAKPAPLKPSKYAGTYTSKLLGTWEFSDVKGTKGLKVAAGPAKYPGTVRPWSGNQFLLVWADSAQTIGDDIEFTVEKGQTTGMVYEGKHAFKKVK